MDIVSDRVYHGSMSISWKNEKRKIADLTPAPYNPRQMTEKQARDLEVSLERFDLADPVVINRNGRIIGGHQRIEILRRRGTIEVDVRVPDRELTETEERELNLRLNRNLGEWDWGKLAEFDPGMLKDVGFDALEMVRLLHGVVEDGMDADAEAEAITEPQTSLGDIYKLGRHRLLCGDSTEREDVSRVMDGNLADMVFTDPPYNVDYNYQAKYEAINHGRKKRFLDGGKILNDKKSPEEYYQFLLAVFQNIYEFSKPEMSLYVCHATKTQEEVWRAWKEARFHFSQTIIWLKERFILGMSQDYHRIYEPILFGWKQGENHWKNKTITKVSEFWTLDQTSFEEEMDIWYVNRDKSVEYEHPTQKPIRLPERAIRKNCPPEGLIFEPFGGGGSSLLAAEQLNRSCYAIELDPRYCDVIVRRWERLTGQEAKKL